MRPRHANLLGATRAPNYLPIRHGERPLLSCRNSRNIRIIPLHSAGKQSGQLRRLALCRSGRRITLTISTRHNQRRAKKWPICLPVNMISPAPKTTASQWRPQRRARR